MKKLIMSIMALFLLALPVQANAKDFYEGKVITIIVGSATGGGLSLNAQLLAKFITKHIPGNPTVIVSYKSGAGGVKLANYLNRENRTNDGTEIGMLLSTTLISSVLKKKNIAFDLDSFAHIGGIDKARTGVVVTAASGVTSIADARTTQIVMGATSKRSQTSVIPSLMNQILGTNFKVVTGYKGTGPIFAAIERDEVGGVAMFYSSILVARPHWPRDGFTNVLAFLATTPDPTMPNVPLLRDLATNTADKKVFDFMATTGAFGRSFLVSSQVPSERIAILRKAFDDTMKDPEFLAFAASRNFPVNPVSAEMLNAEIDNLKAILASNPEVVTRLRALMGIK